MHHETNNLRMLLDTENLLNCMGNPIDVGKALSKAKMIMYYFTAAWCTPCARHLAQIKEIYHINKQEDYGLEIIFVSSDKNEKEFLDFFLHRHGGWLAIPFRDSATFALRSMYQVDFVPSIVVVEEETGDIITNKGTKDIEELGENVLPAWSRIPP